LAARESIFQTTLKEVQRERVKRSPLVTSLTIFSLLLTLCYGIMVTDRARAASGSKSGHGGSDKSAKISPDLSADGGDASLVKVILQLSSKPSGQLNALLNRNGVHIRAHFQLRVLNSQGTGTVSAVLGALNWVMSNRSTYNIRVVNMSLGMRAVDSYKNDPVCKAVRSLVDAGVVAIAAAGNSGKNSAGQKVYGQIHSPGNEPSAITVGASNTYGTDARNDDTVTTYSSRGPTRGYWTDTYGTKHYDNLIKPDIVAPGNKLVSAEA
jgi:subtilisin family serine protease